MAPMIAAERLRILDQHEIAAYRVVEPAALLAHFCPLLARIEKLLHVIVVYLDEVVSVYAHAADVGEVGFDLLAAGSFRFWLTHVFPLSLIGVLPIYEHCTPLCIFCNAVIREAGRASRTTTSRRER